MGSWPAMSVRLKYLQGSFVREEVRPSKSAAIARAGELMLETADCSQFQIVDHKGCVLLADRQIKVAYDKLWENDATLPTDLL
jgi:hypothetical protein